ncbi:UDP-glycosyltransferase 87A1-like [Humulus lupulus]|uniref:UDP-glycosyltransferase 87A1-like n=1 Tax=Humulus lupulus TaxID=3486 RepID=UPI002B402AE8|nr:UDP-glycosyltransferase 87A1-like [Humulus lupulus]
MNDQLTMVCHVVAMPYPGRSHINAVMNLCKQLSSRVKYDILITFVVTEEWFGLIGSDPKPDSIRFATIPNVVPSEHVRANQFADFFEAAATKLEAPFEELLDRLHGPPVRAIIADSLMAWPIKVGHRRNIPVASFWPLSASMFSVLYHFDHFAQHGHYPVKLSV